MECSSMVGVVALCSGDPDSNPGWFPVSNSKLENWVYMNNTSLWWSDADCNHSDCE